MLFDLLLLLNLLMTEHLNLHLVIFGLPPVKNPLLMLLNLLQIELLAVKLMLLVVLLMHLVEP